MTLVINDNCSQIWVVVQFEIRETKMGLFWDCPGRHTLIERTFAVHNERARRAYLGPLTDAGNDSEVQVFEQSGESRKVKKLDRFEKARLAASSCLLRLPFSPRLEKAYNPAS